MTQRTLFSLIIGSSYYLLVYLSLLHVSIFITLFSVIDSLSINGIIFSLLMLSFIFYCRRFQWLGKAKSVIKIERNSEQRWTILYSDNHQQHELQLTCCYVTMAFIILYFKGEHRWQRYSVFIAADAVDSERLRQLRVYCRDPKTFL